MSDLYKIIRFSQDGPNRVIRMDLTLEEAQAWCNNPETSSRTCSPEMREIAAEVFGTSWFDGYDLQNPTDEQLAERAESDRKLADAIAAMRELGL